VALQGVRTREEKRGQSGRQEISNTVREGELGEANEKRKRRMKEPLRDMGYWASHFKTKKPKGERVPRGEKRHLPLEQRG